VLTPPPGGCCGAIVDGLTGSGQAVLVTLAHGQRASEDEYLVLERASETKHEYVNGEIVAMAGASPRDNLVAANITGALRDRLRDRPCLVLPSDQRVHVSATGLRAYPDVTVVCGRPELDKQDTMAIVNPMVIFEVLSESTEAFDRGAKFAHYRHLSSLSEYVLVSLEDRRIEHYRRLDGGQWLLSEVAGEGSRLALPVLDASIDLREVFEKLDLLEPPPA
jgi:Uma2 family endonuclease